MTQQRQALQNEPHSSVSKPAIVDFDLLNPQHNDPQDKTNDNVLNGRVDALLVFFAKRFRSRISVLLRFILPRIKLDENMRVLYDDGSIGSNIIDLVRYYTIPTNTKTTRPTDAVRFGLWLKQIGAPLSVLTRDIFLKRSNEDNISAVKQPLSVPPKSAHNASKSPRSKWKAV